MTTKEVNGHASSAADGEKQTKMEGDTREEKASSQQLHHDKISTATTISVSGVNVLPNNNTDVEAFGERDQDKALRRKWEYFPGKNRFYCNGRVMTAPSIRFCVLSFALILLTFTLFLIFDAPFLTERVTVAVPIVGSILFISVVVNMFKTSFSDPGIIPRASQQEVDHLEKLYYSTNFRPPPRTKDIVVNGQVIKSKYCFTCKMFRPPRASHCGVCDNCVDRFDHHCPFLGNCIGKRNYRSFYTFIVSLSFLAVFVLSASIAHLVMLSKERGNFLDALRDSPSSAVVIVISFFGMWTVIGLTGFHTYLIAVEQTTNEDIKGLFGRANAKNPFSHGNFCQNCCFVLCGPSQPSLLDPRGFATSDFVASLPRKTDPNGMLSPGKTSQLTPAKSSSNCANEQMGQQGLGGSFGGSNKIYREQPPLAVQPVQHQPLQFSSPPPESTSAQLQQQHSKVPLPGLPIIPPEEKVLLKGQTRNGRTVVSDYRQTVPESIQEMKLPHGQPLTSPSAASTVSLSTVSTSNISNDYDTVSPVGVSVTTSNMSNNHLKNLNNASSSKRVFLTSTSSEQRKLKDTESDPYDSERLVDPSDFDDDLDMPSLSNVNDIEMRKNIKTFRGSNSQSQTTSNGNVAFTDYRARRHRQG
ncbi:putative palmitoyltransferase ZDHHC14 [Orchesella cincta]|uniref:Palmitoyltransferase n=1 Tax=Orchesella cincta TaxID=48709 RepID=A0A1D2NDX3_ORCCI|nr:putative palmitoyltransferase ZDHHC14 [Orchesella cincta]